MSLRALAVYVVGWAVVAAVVAVVATRLVDDNGAEDVALPPLQETELTAAASKAGCVLRLGRIQERGLIAEGPRGEPARAAVYDKDRPPVAQIVAALRRGAVVIDYHPDVSAKLVDDLTELQRAVPRGTIVAPNADMEFTVAVTAWRRVLGCRRLDDGTLQAVRLFQGRFIGSGPDATK